ncbi:MAG: hypothetical protein KDC95_17535 [Planctomycetes bacterium]|nr:hypothetical protein [Planctomycetota bacterium]
MVWTCAVVSSARSQTTEDLQRRIEELELRHSAEVDALREELRAVTRDAPREVQDGEPVPRRGLSEGGQTTVFDNLFNPAISVIGDFVFAGSDQDDAFDRLNRFTLRDVEVGFVGRVDPFASYQVYLHIEEETGFEIEEAYVFVDDALPDTFELKVGHYSVDFGKFSALHDHDLPMLDKPQVLQDYLGGSLRGTGVELHHWTGLGDTSTLRWSAGITNGIQGDAHSMFGPAAGHHHSHDGADVESFGKRRFENFAFHGRATAVVELGAAATVQVGASIAYQPKAVRFFEDTSMQPFRRSFEQRVVGLDATYRNVDQATGRGVVLVGEALWSTQEFSNDGFDVSRVGAFGGHLCGEAFLGRQWSVGATAGAFEHAEDASERSSDYGAFATWKVDEFNRLRLEARRFQDPGPDSFGISMQWTIILGTHGHGIPW